MAFRFRQVLLYYHIHYIQQLISSLKSKATLLQAWTGP